MIYHKPKNKTIMKNLATAVIAVMKAVKGVEKNLTVGSGNSSYKGVADQDVKQIIGDAMTKNGLCIIPIGTEAKTQIERWEEVDPYSKSVPKDMKTKQSVFTEVTTKYLLLHESGESVELMGYGHGIDTQDKGAGKATTYALKYTLLYTFLVPTGKIDDADMTHSQDMETPKLKANQVDFSNVPDESERQILVHLLFNSTFDKEAQDKYLKAINTCTDYEGYNKIKDRLDARQIPIDQIQNPSQKDISSHIKKVTKADKEAA